MKIMIVDDNPKMRTTIRRFVEQAGDEIIEASDGIEALAAFQLRRPDWVMMDIRMPRLDGLAAVKVLRSRYSDARIIMVTENCDERSKRAALALGVMGFVSKESLAELRTLVHRDE